MVRKISCSAAQGRSESRGRRFSKDVTPGKNVRRPDPPAHVRRATSGSKSCDGKSQKKDQQIFGFQIIALRRFLCPESIKISASLTSRMI
jgi:hypothetical protein